MIFSYDLEKKVLSGLLQHQHKWEEVSSFLNESDFYSDMYSDTVETTSKKDITDWGQAGLTKEHLVNSPNINDNYFSPKNPTA